MADKNSYNQPRMFEYNDAKSDKFWEIQLDGASHTVRYGRVGTDGQTKTKEFADAEKAVASYEKLVKAKVGKGYKEISDQSTSRSAAVAKAKEKNKEHAPFLEAISKDQDNLDSYLVFADYLEEQGDPRGEFIRTQCALGDEATSAAERKKLKALEKKLLKANQAEWLGDLADDLINQKAPEEFGRYGDSKIYNWAFARGFLDSLTISYLLPKFAKLLKKSSSAKGLRRLVIRHTSNGYDFEDYEEYQDEEFDEDGSPGFEALLGIKLENLRYLEISEDDQMSCHIRCEGIERLLKQTPRLEVLGLHCHEIDTTKLFKSKLPELRSLSVKHCHNFDFKALAGNKAFAKLESICFHPHAMEYGEDEAYIGNDDFASLCKSKNLTSLKEIDLTCTSLEDPAIESLVKSSLLGQLETIKIAHSGLKDESANLLAAADLGNLKTLDLSYNYMTEEGVETLTAAFPRLVAQQQYAISSYEEGEHLYQGDYE